MMVSSIFKQFAICVNSRKIVISIYSWLSIISLCIVYRGLPPIMLAAKLFFAMTGMALGMYLWNDVCDFIQDTSSKEVEDFTPSGRPLGRGLVSKRRMGFFSALLVALGLMSSALININVLLIQLAFLIVFFIYSTEPIRLKRIFLWKQLTVSIGGVIACLSAGLAAGIISVHLLYMTVLFFLFNMGVNPIVDLRDIDSDRAGGIKTVPIVWGPSFTVRLAIATFTAAAATTWIGFYSLGFNIALPIIGTIVCAAFAYVMYPLLSHLDDPELSYKIIYVRGLPLYYVLQLAVLVGTFPI